MSTAQRIAQSNRFVTPVLSFRSCRWPPHKALAVEADGILRAMIISLLGVRRLTDHAWFEFHADA